MKRAQERGTAASLVATIAGLIILYILFLPPADRADLLGDSPTTVTTTTGINTGTTTDTATTGSIFTASPGKIFYQKLDEYEYDISPFTLFKISNAAVITTVNNFRIRNGMFDKIKKNLTFEIRDLENTDNTLISFSTPRHAGVLTIKLNGAEIYQFETDKTTPEPVALDKSSLREGTNVLEFEVSGVGMRFWATNEYDFTGMKITADITDISRQESKNSFYITADQAKNLEKANLQFNPDCQPSQAGVLDVTLNGKTIFSGVPDCGSLNTYDFSPGTLNTGKNSINFKTEAGSYLVDQIKIKTGLKEPVQPTYYFELKDDLFKNVKEVEKKCGDIDGYCPKDCSADIDIDCCFKDNPNGYWCTTKTDNLGDRCVGFVQEDECGRCKSGYQDKGGDIADACKNKCGDNNDGECPADCSPNHDKDCCFQKEGENQFFCESLPVTGEDFICMNEITQTSCQNCLTGYKAEGTSFECPQSTEDKNAKLKSGININIIFSFTESTEDKEAEIWVNGAQTGFDTHESSYRKNINDLVEPGTNSILIKPKTDLDIRQIEVKFD